MNPHKIGVRSGNTYCLANALPLDQRGKQETTEKKCPECQWQKLVLPQKRTTDAISVAGVLAACNWFLYMAVISNETPKIAIPMNVKGDQLGFSQ